MAASQDSLEDLHTVLATTLSTAIREGVPLVDAKTGKVTKAPAPAAILNVARQFLKDNNIQSTTDKPPVGQLAASLPDFDSETAYH